MALLASNLITSLRVTTADPSAVTWADADWLIFLAEAERQTCMLKPDAYVTRGTIPLVAGSKQALPAGATGLMDLFANVTSGRSVTQVSRSLLDESQRWTAPPTQAVDVSDWTHDPRDPLRFECYPPNDGTGQLDALYGITPPAFATPATPLHVPDLYESVLKYFALAEAYAANTKRGDVAKVAYYRGEAAKLLGARAQSQSGYAPKTDTPGGS